MDSIYSVIYIIYNIFFKFNAILYFKKYLLNLMPFYILIILNVHNFLINFPNIAFNKIY